MKPVSNYRSNAYQELRSVFVIEDKMSNTNESLGTKITILIPVKIL